MAVLSRVAARCQASLKLLSVVPRDVGPLKLVNRRKNHDGLCES